MDSSIIEPNDSIPSVMKIDIPSFSSREFIDLIVNKFSALTNPVFQTDDYVVMNLPFGRAVYSILNNGLTIALMDFTPSAPALETEFKGTDKEIPYKISFCLKGLYSVDYQDKNLMETVNAGECLINAPLYGS